MWAVGIIIGALLGGTAGGAGAAVTGGLIGLVLGLWAGHDRKANAARILTLESRVTQLADEMSEWRSGAAMNVAPIGDSPLASTVGPIKAEAPASQASGIIAPASEAAAAEAAAGDPLAGYATRGTAALPVRKGGSGTPERADIPATESAETLPPIPELAAVPAEPTPRPAWLAWMLGGNTLARLGVLILFIGVGFLLKFAAERVVVPIEVRLAGVALGGIALLVIGWMLRGKRAGYAMILQGAGVGVMYLTIFAALRLYSLLPPGAAFALLFLVAAFSSFLAVRQDAIALAALGIIGGFLAPILTSSGSGNHVALFSYYALLNASILAIAWYKAWRVLNVIGFVFTFAVGAAWGFTRYRPELFSTTEPFLILAFVFYVALAVLYALKRSIAMRTYVDSTIVFGTPLIVGGLQSGLVRDMPFGMAISALTASAIYLSLARMLHARRDEGVRMLVEAFLALGVILATLAIPLALDARWTSATWALEGAALLWVGVRQQRGAARVFGLLLQLAAGAALAVGVDIWRTTPPTGLLPILNSDYIGAVLVGIAGLFSAWLLQRREDELRTWEKFAALLMFAWGILWWIFAAWHEVDRWLPVAMHLPAMVIVLTLTAVLFAVAEKRMTWPIARVPVLALLPVLLLIALGSVDFPVAARTHLFAQGGYVAWPLAVVAIILLLKRYDRVNAIDGYANNSIVDGAHGSRADAAVISLDGWHAALLWLVVLVLASELAWAGSRLGGGSGVWSVVPWGLVGAASLLFVTAMANKPVWPMRAHRTGYLIFGAAPIAAAVVVWSLIANCSGDGDPLPLPYVVLLNPLDITEALAILSVATWSLRLQRDGAKLGGLLRPRVTGALLAALSFVWINAIVLRSIHFWYDVPYDLDALWDSRLVQASLSLLWSSLALATMVYANRGLRRAAWIGGAVLLGVVVVKLFIVDLSQVGGVERIVSFIGVGLLLLVIGFVAPVPPRRVEAA